MFLSLTCYDCDNAECELCPLGSCIDSESLEGCTRQVTEEFCARYQHEKNEVMPFALASNNADFATIDNIQQLLYSKRIGTMLDANGKATPRKKEIVDRLNIGIERLEE